MPRSPQTFRSFRDARTIGVFAVGLFLTLVIAACETANGTGTSNATAKSLPLGRGDLAETRTTSAISPGLSHHTIRRFSISGSSELWVLRSLPLRSASESSTAKACLANNAETVHKADAYAYPGRPELTYDVLQTREFPSLEAVRGSTAYANLKTCGFKPQDLRFTPHGDSGPWEINVLEIDPAKFSGRLSIDLAGGAVAGLAPVSEIAERAGARAAVNGSFFVMHETDGIVGDVAGLSVLDGRVYSEPLNGRAALVITNSPKLSASIEDAAAQIALVLKDGTRIPVDGINRMPGRSRNCGNDGDHPTSMALHDVTCFDDGEIIVLDEKAGFELGPSFSFRAFVNHVGLVLDHEPADGIPNDGYLVIATGDRAEELAQVLKPGEIVEIETAFGEGKSDVFALNGAPLLLKGGASIDRAHLEGWPLDELTPATLADEMHQWFSLRAPRTAVGVRKDGHILFVTIDGRRGDVSVGATIDELRGVMRALGAVDALNLDGGGSTTLVVDGEIKNTPSDQTGPRPVADAVLFFDRAN